MRTITVTVSGKQYEFPASMSLLRRAELFSGISTAKAVAPDTRDFGSVGFILGVVAAGLEHCGETFGFPVVVEQDGTKTRPGFFEAVGDRIEWEEMDPLYMAVWLALKPELADQLNGETAEEVGESSDPPAGLTGSGSPTASSDSNPASSTISAGPSSGKP